jgi:ankyrin repeat protein
MSPTKKTLIVVFGGMAVMVVTTICGVAIMVAIIPMEKGGLAMLGYLYVYAVGTEQSVQLSGYQSGFGLATRSVARKMQHPMKLYQTTPPLERRRVVVRGQQLKRLENCAQRDECRLTMKSQLIAIVAAVLVVGCGESQHSVPAPEAKPVEPVAEAAQPEPTTTKSPDISIHEAVEKGNIEAVKYHLTAGTDVEVKDGEGWTLLQMAAGEGHKEIAELLIAKGADVNAMNADGLTALFAAILGPHKEMAELLIAKGADVNAKGFFGMTPLNMANDEGEKEMADLLRKHGGKTAKELKAEGKNSIHEAAEDGNIEAVKQHLAAGADVNAKDGWGMTPLHYAAFFGHKEVTELLIDKGAEVNAKEGDTGKTPLHEAHNKEIAELLISKGADVNAKDKFEQTTLHSAASEGHNETAELLIAKGLDVNAKNDGGETPLHSAGNKEVAELLIEKGADVNAKDVDGDTPLDWATHPSNPNASAETADLLRKHGGKTAEELKAEGK